MKIFVIGKFYVEGFAEHVAETLEVMGHSVLRHEVGPKVEIQPTQLRRQWSRVIHIVHNLSQDVEYFRSRAERSLFEAVEREPIDIIIVCHDFLRPREVSRIREVSKAPVSLWFPDAISQFRKAYFLNAGYDALFFKDPYIVHVLKRVLPQPIYYLPECCNPIHHRTAEMSSKDIAKYGCQIATAGNLYSYRAAFFAELGDYDVKIWGLPPARWLDKSRIGKMIQNEFVANIEKSKAFKAASIVVNNLNPAEIWGINVRAFEIAAAGGFQLIDWRPGLSQLFDDGQEIVSFKTMGDLKAKINWYLQHEDERVEISKRGMARAHNEHTYAKRLGCLINTVAGRSSGFPIPEC